jgi:hypothetical protein
MQAQPDAANAAPARRYARDIVDAVLENMRQNLEPLKYCTLAPTRYLVYLHASEYRRLEGILPRIRGETIQALTDELAAINRRSRRLHRLRVWLGRAGAEVEGAGEWTIEFLPDPDGELSEGDILVDSELTLPAQPELGAGSRTRRILTGRVGLVTTRREQIEDQTVRPADPAPGTVYARLAYTDDDGPHRVDVVKDSIVVGRGGVAYRVDVRVNAAVDVSREHLRIRRDPASGRFFVSDLSTLGTTVDGRPVPKGYEEKDGTKRENGVETPLGDSARIGLAGMLFLDFRAVRR